MGKLDNEWGCSSTSLTLRQLGLFTSRTLALSIESLNCRRRLAGCKLRSRYAGCIPADERLVLIIRRTFGVSTLRGIPRRYRLVTYVQVPSGEVTRAPRRTDLRGASKSNNNNADTLLFLCSPCSQ